MEADVDEDVAACRLRAAFPVSLMPERCSSLSDDWLPVIRCEALCGNEMECNNGSQK